MYKLYKPNHPPVWRRYAVETHAPYSTRTTQPLRLQHSNRPTWRAHCQHTTALPRVSHWLRTRILPVHWLPSRGNAEPWVLKQVVTKIFNEWVWIAKVNFLPKLLIDAVFSFDYVFCLNFHRTKMILIKRTMFIIYYKNKCCSKYFTNTMRV